MQKHKVLLILFLATLLFYLPILLNPKLILERGNDLQEFFWPIFYFVQQQILEHNTFPLWNNLFLSGTPLLPDPQSPLFYPPNIIFLILHIDTAFLASFMFHSFFGGVGAYLAARHGLGFSTAGSSISALFYIVLPRTAGFLEAGHFGLVASSTWIPFLLLASLRLIKTSHFGWAILFAVSLAGLFFTHPTTSAAAAALASSTIFLAGSYVLVKKHSVKTLIVLAAGLFLTFGLIAVTFLPQLEWLPQTTRFLLLGDRDVYPKWDGKIEFVKAIYPHALGSRYAIDSLDTEKWLALGIFISVLSLVSCSYVPNSKC